MARRALVLLLCCGVLGCGGEDRATDAERDDLVEQVEAAAEESRLLAAEAAGPVPEVQNQSVFVSWIRRSCERMDDACGIQKTRCVRCWGKRDREVCLFECHLASQACDQAADCWRTFEELFRQAAAPGQVGD